jgi:hypothetical protein
VDLVNEHNVIRLEIREDRRQIASLGQNRTGRHPKPDAKLARDDLGQRRFSKTGRAMEQDVVHGLPPSPGAFDEDAQIGARFGLTDERVKRLWSEGTIGILRAWFRA